MDKINVLVVDDQPGIRFLMEVIVTDMGHQYATAKNGAEALEMVQKSQPDLVFMDICMPVMNGMDALVKMKKIVPNTEVVLMTAYSTKESMEVALKNGALCCIRKPFDVDEIKNFLYDFVWQWRQGKPIEFPVFEDIHCTA